MAFTANDVMTLRKQTGTGMMDCKKALTEADGDMDRAADILREKGLAAAAKKAGRIAAEGIVDSYISEDGMTGVVVEVNCETDFVAKTDAFKELVGKIAKLIAETAPADVEALMASAYEDGTVESLISNSVAKIGEKISIRRFERIEGFVDSYIHLGGKIGVLVQADKKPDMVKMHDIALQIAAAKPLYIVKEEVPSDVVEHEKEIIRVQALNEPKPKPEAIIEKMIVGRIQKYYKEVCLIEQPFVKDDSLTVGKMINGEFNVVRFVRYEMGEGLQKREDDFVGEVMSQINK